MLEKIKQFKQVLPREKTNKQIQDSIKANILRTLEQGTLYPTKIHRPEIF